MSTFLDEVPEVVVLPQISIRQPRFLFDVGDALGASSIPDG